MLVYPSYPSFARVVRYWRKRRRISMKKLALEVGMRRMDLMCMEHERLCPHFTYSQLKRMAEVLRISCEELLNTDM